MVYLRRGPRRFTVYPFFCRSTKKVSSVYAWEIPGQMRLVATINGVTKIGTQLSTQTY